MKKQILIITAILTILLCNSGSASFVLEPAETQINLTHDYQPGNTTRKISIYNNKEEQLNVTWYKEHPYQPTRKKDRTNISNLSWIDVTPSWQEIFPHNKTNFYIHLNIPKNYSFKGEKWEVWVTFKINSEGQDNLKVEQVAKILIDTPDEINDDKNSSECTDKKNSGFNFFQYVALILVVIAILIITYLFKRRQL
ncbi:MAG: hypothetical protein V5A64_03015 [Candidatus Thermoplasmatota archaeon]